MNIGGALKKGDIGSLLDPLNLFGLKGLGTDEEKPAPAPAAPSSSIPEPIIKDTPETPENSPRLRKIAQSARATSVLTSNSDDTLLGG